MNASANISVSENRLVLVLFDGENYLAEGVTLEIAIRDPNQPGHPITWTGTPTLYTDYDPPIWVSYPEFTGSGSWRVEAEVTFPGGEVRTDSLLVRVVEEADGILPGETAPASDTFVWDGETPLYRHTTDITPNPAFFEQSIAEAVANGKPSLVIFASPGLCTDFICTPVLDTTYEALYERYGDALNFIHVEVYDLQTSDYVPAMEEWGLNYHPWIYLIDAEGVVVARYEGALSVEEVTPIIEEMLTLGSRSR
jgi:hypothetical protein